MSTERIVVIGADAAGMSAAHQALRTARDRGRRIEVVVLEVTRHTSYSACGLPYWIAGDVVSGTDLVARSAEKHRQAGIDLRLETRATGIDTDRGLVLVEHGEPVAFDQVMLATGAEPIVPGWVREPSGAVRDGIGVVHTLDDGQLWLDRFAAVERSEGRRVVVAGGGYIGIEMAEAARRRGFEVTVVTRSRVLASLDPVMGEKVVAGMRVAGVDVVEDTTVAGVDLVDGGLAGVRDDAGTTYPCDLLVVALGVRARTDMAVAAGLEVGPSGGLLVDEQGTAAPGFWAAGDCAATRHRLTGEPVFLPLGTHANKAGRVVGTNLGGGEARFPGVLGTAITRFVHDPVHLEIARTGLSAEEAQAHGLDAVAVLTEGSTASGYMPEAEAISIQVVAERGTRRLLGVQIVGGPGAGKRIDTAAMALWHSGSIDDLAWADLAYAPPFATAWEILQIAARRAAERLDD